MPITQLSYHICDFIQDANGRLYVLEFGDAWYNSNFQGRFELSGVDTRCQLIPQHLEAIGRRSYWFTAMRNLTEVVRKQKYYEDSITYVDSIANAPIDPTRPKIIIVLGQDDDHTKELIQELTAQNKQKLQAQQSSPPDIILNGTNDMMWLLNRDKKILNTFLALNDLSTFQPRTWHHECKQGSVFTVPEGVAHFIIKQTDGTLAEGTMVVPSEDLALVLEVIADQDATRLSPDQLTRYGKAISHYQTESHRNVIIQEVCFSKTKTVQREIGETEHHAAGRAVFAVTQEDQKLRKVEIVDLFWKLALQPSAPDQVSNESILSATHDLDFNCWPSFTLAEKQSVKPVLTTMIISIMQTAIKMDVRSYLLTLAQQQRITEIQYFMQHYSHVRVNRLDRELIETLKRGYPQLSQVYLLEQAEYYLLPHHVEYPQDGALLAWLFEEIENVNCSFKTRLEKFIAQELVNLAELGLNKKESAWFERVNLIKQKMNAPKASVAAGLPFFKSNAGQTEIVINPAPGVTSSPSMT